ncbi:MAG TPA: hypothetical protein VMS71_01910, partial [Candidatus Acidoferrum sp.]|nr:hypothetical protein [Candidatus Acidoferrum sp.]
MKILVLVRDGDIRHTVISALQTEKFEVLQPDSAKKAIATLETDPDIDLLIAEPCSPSDEKTCIVSYLKSSPRISWIPVVAVKAELDSDTLHMCLKLGVN